MPTTAGRMSEAERRALREDGVVYIQAGEAAGSGALLYDGRAVLTAGHVVDLVTNVANPSVRLNVDNSTITRGVDDALIHPEYDPRSYGKDLALLWLDDGAPAEATRYVPYRNADELGKVATLIGYGDSGTGDRGILPDTAGTRRSVENRLDSDGGAINDFFGGSESVGLEANAHFLIDFDNGLIANDALGQLIGARDLGLGSLEGMVAPGDSGGPALIDGAIAGVTNAIASLSNGSANPDVDNTLNASYGEIGSFQRVSTQQQWLDQSLRARYPDAPQTPDEVPVAVMEEDDEVTYAYFMLQFTGVRSFPEQILSVDFRTEDRTATAGEDYIPAEGTLNLYPGERHAVVPVEVIGDTRAEGNETFALSVYNPVGGSFGEGVDTLTATRLITDDDGVWA